MKSGNDSDLKKVLPPNLKNVLPEKTFNDLFGNNPEPTYYNQNDPRWGGIPYSVKNPLDPTQTIATTGCGPTAMAMVISTLTGKSVTPDIAAKYALEHGYGSENGGTKWGFFPAMGEEYGLEVKQTGNFNEVTDALQNGAMVIASMGKGTFTSSGHFIVLSDMKNGEIYVLDPNSEAKSKNWPSYVIRSEATKKADPYFVITK